MKKSLLFAFWVWAGLSASNTMDCVNASAKETLWIYTSIYKEHLPIIEKDFEKKHPDIDLQFFQAGSEKLQAKVEAELSAKRPQVDVIMTADPFWARDIEKRGLVDSSQGPALSNTHYSIMVMVTHKDYPKDKRPKAFSDLVQPQFKGLVQSGSPLESGTNFSAIAVLSRKYGWDYFKKLRDNQLTANGGSATVMQKVESGEKKIGIALLENALSNLRRQSPVEIIYPTDGAIIIPNVQLTLKTSPHAAAAQKYKNYISSVEGQNILRQGSMYSVRKDILPPQGGAPLAKVIQNSIEWTPELVDSIAADAKNIKKKFSELILE